MSDDISAKVAQGMLERFEAGASKQLINAPRTFPVRGQVWKHYKGDTVTIVACAFIEATFNGTSTSRSVERVVIYDHGGKVFSRPLPEFMSTVEVGTRYCYRFMLEET